MTHREYKGWRIELQPNKAPDADGWRIYVTVASSTGESVRTMPLFFKDGRAFPTQEAAEAAGVELATVWIDHQG
jgi:hypothetical protein